MKGLSHVWVVQDFFEIGDHELGEEPLFPERVFVDRATARWHSTANSPTGHRSVYGPSLVPLEEALEWGWQRSTDVTLETAEGTTTVPKGAIINARQALWSPTTVALERVGAPVDWRATWVLGLTPPDLELARPGFAARLTDMPEASDVDTTTDGGQLAADFTVTVANEQLAHHLATHVGLRAATDVPSGLADVLNGRLSVSVGLL